MSETVTLDPSEIATDRTELNITSFIKWEGVEYGDAEIAAYMADQRQGSTPVDYRIPNRTVEIPLVLRVQGATSYATIRANLQAKVALFQREGGWIKRTRSGGGTVFADIVNATLHLGGSSMAGFRDVDVDAWLRLEVLPDWYEAEEVLT
jgi:hypothetical protein